MGIARKTRGVLYALGFLVFLWIVLTLLAQRNGAEQVMVMGRSNVVAKALLVYNPDLFYNLDEQVCKAFAEGLSNQGWQAKVATVAAAERLVNEPFDLYVFCANTYNWAPDRPITTLIDALDLKEKPVVAITLGSGSTERAQRLLETRILEEGAVLIASKSFWLMRPNDEARTDKPNVVIAVEMAKTLGNSVAEKIVAVKK